MKKSIIYISMMLIMLSMVGCAGLGDYEIELINGYRVVRTSGEDRTIFPARDSLEGIVLPDFDNFEDDSEDEGEFIVQVGYDEDRYIVAKTNFNLYYIIDTVETILYGSFDKDEFNEKKKNLDISSNVELKELEEYERDYDWTVVEPE